MARPGVMLGFPSFRGAGSRLWRVPAIERTGSGALVPIRPYLGATA
jgi:hypothetical protein